MKKISKRRMKNFILIIMKILRLKTQTKIFKKMIITIKRKMIVTHMMMITLLILKNIKNLKGMKMILCVN